MKKLPIVMAAVCAATFTVSMSSVFAGEKGDGSSAPVQSQAISLDEFKARCAHPKDFDKQVAPENIQVSCTNVETEFVPEQPGTFAMLSTRKITAGVTSSKWHVGGVDAKDIPVAQKSGSCLRFKEVERTLTSSRQLSCNDILNLKGDLDEYCTSVVDSSKASSPKMIDTKDTGRMIDTCGGIQVVATGKGLE